MHNVTITLGGEAFESWSSYDINISMEKLVSTFSLSVTDTTSQINNTVWKIRPQEEVSIKIDGKLLITGYVDGVSTDISSQNHTIKINGRSKTADLVDCSAKQVLQKFAFNNTNILQLAKALCDPFGIKVEVQEGTKVDETFKLNVTTSESAFSVLDSKAKELSILLLTNTRGALVLGNTTKEKANDQLELGVNILSASSSFSYVNRFSNYEVIGQGSAPKAWVNNINVRASSEDEGVKRYRPLIIQGTGQLNTQRAQLRANWESNVRAAKSTNISVVVQGHFQSNGDLWEINKIVSFLAPALYVNPATDLLISSINYTLGDDGTKTELALKLPDSFISDPSQKVSTNTKIGWDAL